jgi:hypothetical protein
MLTHVSFEGNSIFQNSPKGLENRVQNTKQSLIATFGIRRAEIAALCLARGFSAGHVQAISSKNIF